MHQIALLAGHIHWGLYPMTLEKGMMENGETEK